MTLSKGGASRQTIVVTGASGFIGRHIVERLASAGHRIISLSRMRGDSPAHTVEEVFRWQLGSPLPTSIQADTAIHLAHDFDKGRGAEITINGTLLLARELMESGVRRQIFVSSYSAGPHAISLYGRTKDFLEKVFVKDYQGVIVRPGLVIGDGGIFAKMASFARVSPLIPLPDGGNGRVPVIGIERLAEEMLKLVETPNPRKENNIFYSDFASLRDLVLDQANNAGRHPLIISVPVALVLPAMRCLEWLGFSLPVSSDSLVGFVGNQSASHVSTIED